MCDEGARKQSSRLSPITLTDSTQVVRHQKVRKSSQILRYGNEEMVRKMWVRTEGHSLKVKQTPWGRNWSKYFTMAKENKNVFQHDAYRPRQRSPLQGVGVRIYLDTLPPRYLTPPLQKGIGPEIPYPQKEHGTRDTLPPCGQTDSCKNITFPCIW